jgi:hypothetical protein
MEVAAANPDIGDFEEDFVGSDRRAFDFSEFDRSGFRCVIDDGWGVHK